MIARRVTLTATLILVGAISATAEDHQLGEILYDTRLGLELRMPTEWEIKHSPDGLELEDHLVLLGPDRCAYGRCFIAIGQRPDLLSAADSLGEWAQEFAEKLSIGNEILTVGANAYGSNAEFEDSILVEGGEYHSVNFKRGSEVWFVAANFPASSSLEVAFQTVLLNLRIVPGDSRLYSSLKEDGEYLSLPGPWEQNLSSSWYSPVRNQSNGQPWPVHCGSPAHSGGSLYAADVDADHGTPVRAAKEGVVYTADSVGAASGFGKYVVIRTGDSGNSTDYYHYYAHLSSVRSYITEGYVVKRRGLLLGHVGDTGSEGATHLHFHVQRGASHTTASPLVLNGMYGFEDVDYPNGGYYCATMGR